MSHAAARLCARCGAVRAGGGRCVACGAGLSAEVRDGCVVAVPAGCIACARCATTARPVRFRGWVRLASALWWTRERRHGAYVCASCTRRGTAAALLYCALLGWWAIGSWAWLGWRALALNLRAVAAPPADPGAWGAHRVDRFAHGLPHLGGGLSDRLDEAAIGASPLGRLQNGRRRAVLGASALYETIGVSALASAEELQLAYRERSKRLHPDVRSDGGEEMIRLNQAWEILRHADTRAAYDWLCDQRRPA